MLQKIGLNNILESIFSTKRTIDKESNVRVVDDMISRDEAFALYKMFNKANAKTSIEIGLAHGVSALVFCQAHNDFGDGDGVHYGVDPNQFTSYNGAAIRAIEEAGFTKCLKVLAGPSHLEVP